MLVGIAKPYPAYAPVGEDKHGVDTYQFAFRIHQCTTTISLVDGGICLDERFNTAIVYSQSTGLWH